MSSSASSPRTAGRYVLYDEIASGGMASVYLARLIGPIGFGRTVAIKRLHPHLTDDRTIVSMFVDEARLASRVQHTNVVPVLDVTFDDRELLLVMDYIHGESLSRLLAAESKRGHRVPVPIAIAIMIGVLYGLHAAHEARSERGQPLELVHRDVSPQNILVGVDGVARVVDFGIAKAAERIHSTSGGHLKGKAAYVSPEQVSGLVVDRRTDVYAASVVCWELLTGLRLFQASSALEIMRKVLDGEFAPPSHHAPDIPPELDAVVLRGLAAKPDGRFASARDMAVALEQACAHASVREVSEWAQAIASDRLRRRADRVAEIERDSAADTYALSDVVPTKPASALAQDDIATVALDSGASVHSQPRLHGHVRRAVVVVAGLCVAAVSLAVYAWPHRDAPPAAVSAPTVAGSASPAPPPTPVAATPVAAPPVTAPPVAAPPVASPPSRPKKRIAASPHATHPASSSAQTADCRVPFEWAADGTKLPKPGCM